MQCIVETLWNTTLKDGYVVLKQVAYIFEHEYPQMEVAYGAKCVTNWTNSLHGAESFLRS